MYADTRELLRDYDLTLDPTARVTDLGVGQQQLVEIVKALAKNSKILLLDEPTAELSGIPIHKVVIGAYALLGGVVALTGFMQTAYAGASTTTVGDLMELDAIAACVIGGTSLKGGRGTVMGVLFGALIMTSLLNGMTLLAVAPEMKYMARGVVLILAVWMDVAVAKK
jgi:D-xylose transport system permease protein